MKINTRVVSRRYLRCLLAASAVIASIQFSAINAANAGTPLPSSAKSTCTFTPAQFNAIFESGSVGTTPNGIVLPADSFSFSPTSLCDFYKWSEQMFLWLTSPAPSRYGSGTHVFDSPVFYSLSAIDSSGNRTLIPHTPGPTLPFLTAISQRGSRGQEVVFDSTGKIHNVVRPAVGPTGKLLARDKAGQPVEINRIQPTREGKPALLDRANKQLEVQTQRNGAPLLFNDIGEPLNLRASTVMINGIHFFVTTSGAVVQTEEGQAGGGALMAQNNSLVFYLLQVNDVDAYFITGMKDIKITNPTPTTFPTTGSALGQITTFAQQAPAPFTKPSFPDNVAMAIEVKSSWIETTGLSNPGDYLTINATIPTYNPPLSQPNNTQSVQSGTKQVTLALVGMHVVGSTLQHPEMIWATFEHVNNTPNPQYTFISSPSNTVATQPADGPGGWVFSSTSAAGGTNNQRLVPNGTTINAVSGQTIGPSDLVRTNPWGTASTDPGFTANNTDIISINKNVIGMLVAGDVRKNYILTGTTWVFNGGPPSTGVITGTPHMANTTMETFFQGGNCFDCHSDATGNMLGISPGSDGFSGGLSHVFAPIQPLFP
jgi:hypothetical protein